MHGDLTAGVRRRGGGGAGRAVRPGRERRRPDQGPAVPRRAGRGDAPIRKMHRDLHHSVRYPNSRHSLTSRRRPYWGQLPVCRLGPDYQATTSVLRLPPLRAGEHSDRRRFQRQHRHQRHCPPSDGTRHRSHVARLSRFSPRRQRLGHRRQRLRLPVRVGDRAGHRGGMLVLAGPATRSYRTFMRLATSCSGTPCGWEQARRPPEPRDQYRRLTHAHAAATGVTRHGAPAAI